MDRIRTDQITRYTFTLLWSWIAVRTALPWLVFFRLTFEGDSYSWGTSYFGHQFYSSGLARPDFLIVYLLLAAGVCILWLLRQHRLHLAAPLLVGYLTVFAADALVELVGGEPLIFRGDTLDVSVNVTALFLTLQFAMLALGLLWWGMLRREGRNPVAPANAGSGLSRWQQRVLVLCTAIVPVQLILLMSGEPHALTDEIGVVLTLLQWFALAIAMFPYRSGHSSRTGLPA